MASSLNTVLFLFFCQLLSGSAADPPITERTAHRGDDVTLSCEAPNNVNIAAVQWIRSDPERLVFLKIDGHLKTAYQDPSYVNRVQLKDDEMKNGELSLILKNVTNNDEGTYECRYVEERGGRKKRADQRKLISIVHLNVEELQEHQITAKPGDYVILSCEVPNVPITAVKWTRSDLQKHVYMKREGHLNTTDQDPSYVNRVQLKDDEMKNGDLSLILKNVNNNDEGTYECHYVEERADQMKFMSIVQLNVRDPQITAQPGDDVILPCPSPSNVIIAAVQWIRSDPERYVYLKSDGHLNTADQDPSYVNRVQLKDDQMKNGDLSLILKNVTNNDEGIYECRYVEKRGGRKKRALTDSELISIVQLNVAGPTVGNSRDGKDKYQYLGVILPVTLIVGLVVVGLVIFMKRRKEKKPV